MKVHCEWILLSLLLCMITCIRYDNKTKGAKVMFELDVFILREKHKFRTVQE